MAKKATASAAAKTRRKISHDDIRCAAEQSLEKFMRLVAPHRVLGQCQIDLIDWWEREDAKAHQLALMPRDHQKSTLMAYRVAHAITNNPAVTVLYISATSGLAMKQLSLIKNILDSKIYRRYWPDMTNISEGKRARWTTEEIEVDHPDRKVEVIRDPTVMTAGLTTSLTGLHFDIAVMDDIVVRENAYTALGRRTVEAQYSLLSSIETADALEWSVGTRYHGKDLYGQMMAMNEDLFDDEGNVVGEKSIYEVYERVVEDRGDGTGAFLWPRQERKDGRWFGFNRQILATKRGKYLDKAQYRAQYYNDPNDPDNEEIERATFQYYDRDKLVHKDGKVFINDRLLNVFAAIDFAFSLSDRADFTALVVIGIDFDNNIYVLDIDRFKTNRILIYYEHIFAAWQRWEFRKIRAEVNVAQEAIVEDLKKNHIAKEGIPLRVVSFRPGRYDGAKEERIAAHLNPRYENGNMWHYKSGITVELEDELIKERPANDDIKDALANAVAIARAPSKQAHSRQTRKEPIQYHQRFGGVQA